MDYTIISLFCIIVCYSFTDRNIMLSSGLLNWNDKQLNEQYNFFKIYKDLNLITATSILTYIININGSIGLIPTNSTINAEQYQSNIHQNLNLPAYPCIFCDATIGSCNNLGDRLEAVFNNKEMFINDLISRSIKYDWNGYTIDFEPDVNIDNIKTTNLMIDLAFQLSKYNKKLFIWINYNVDALYPFNISSLMKYNNIKFLTMNTYYCDYNTFISEASNAIIHAYSLSKFGFGLLTYESNSVIKEDELNKIILWLKIYNNSFLSLWASKIPPNWFIPLNNFLMS